MKAGMNTYNWHMRDVLRKAPMKQEELNVIMTQAEMKAEVKRLKTMLIIISKNAAYGMPGSILRRKRDEAEVAFITLRNKYERLYGAFND